MYSPLLEFSELRRLTELGKTCGESFNREETSGQLEIQYHKRHYRSPIGGDAEPFVVLESVHGNSTVCVGWVVEKGTSSAVETVVFVPGEGSLQ